MDEWLTQKEVKRTKCCCKNANELTDLCKKGHVPIYLYI